MMRWSVIAVVLLAPVASAAAPYDGRWSADPRACTDESALASPVTVAVRSISWTGAFCTVGTSYQVRDVLHISARCWGEGVVSNVPIKLQIRGDRLVLDWGRARSEEMRRCP